MATEPELETPVIEPAPSADTAADLGGFTNSEGKFEANFDDVIDKAFAGLPKPDKQPAADVVKPEGATGPTGPTEVAKPEGASGPTGALAQTGPTGAAPAADDRDKDLEELAGKLGDMSKRPKTKEIIEGYKGKVTQERNQREAAVKEAATLRQQIEELKKLPVPKEVSEELQALRDTVRELDASRDPSIKQKFDTKISANESTIAGVLKEHGMDVKDVEALQKSGFSRRTLHETITKLEKSGDGAAVEAAEQLKDILRENGQLSKAKEAEVAAFKAGAGERTKAAQVETDRQVQAANDRMKASIAEHTAKWPFLAVPPEAKPEDSAAVRAEKERARVQQNDRVNRYNEAIKKETGTPMDAQISARVGILYRDIIAPQLQEQVVAKDKELTQLREQVKAMKGSAGLAKVVTGGGTVKRTEPQEDTADVGDWDSFVDSAARKMGVIK